MDSRALNFCKLEQMSICTAETIRSQGDCSFFEKSRNAERCMYFIFDEYCDCLKAQMDASDLSASGGLVKCTDSAAQSGV